MFPLECFQQLDKHTKFSLAKNRPVFDISHTCLDILNFPVYTASNYNLQILRPDMPFSVIALRNISEIFGNYVGTSLTRYEPEDLVYSADSPAKA